MYPPLPRPTPGPPDEPVQAAGLRIFGFVLATDTTATCTDIELETAAHVYPIVISAPGLLPTTIDRLAETNRAIHAALRRRQAVQATRTEPATPPADNMVGAQNDDQDGGSKVRRPIPPTPPSRPPAVAVPLMNF